MSSSLGNTKGIILSFKVHIMSFITSWWIYLFLVLVCVCEGCEGDKEEGGWQCSVRRLSRLSTASVACSGLVASSNTVVNLVATSQFIMLGIVFIRLSEIVFRDHSIYMNIWRLQTSKLSAVAWSTLSTIYRDKGSPDRRADFSRQFQQANCWKFF